MLSLFCLCIKLAISMIHVRTLDKLPPDRVVPNLKRLQDLDVGPTCNKAPQPVEGQVP